VDAAVVRAVIVAAFAPFAAVIGRPPAPMEADIPALIAAGRVWLEDEGAGVLVCWPEGEVMILDILAVRPEAQGRGLGARLVAECEAQARRQGLAAVELYTNAAMARAQQLYVRLGYSETGRGPHEGFQRVFYRKTL
jgi:ribosomal protein S18 acetylase RimI-like enzyme